MIRKLKTFLPPLAASVDLKQLVELTTIIVIFFAGFCLAAAFGNLSAKREASQS
jgi:hypothetical protein